MLLSQNRPKFWRGLCESRIANIRIDAYVRTNSLNRYWKERCISVRLLDQHAGRCLRFHYLAACWNVTKQHVGDNVAVLKPTVKLQYHFHATVWTSDQQYISGQCLFLFPGQFLCSCSAYIEQTPQRRKGKAGFNPSTVREFQDLFSTWLKLWLVRMFV